jgi:hypothetical protein
MLSMPLGRATLLVLVTLALSVATVLIPLRLVTGAILLFA